ncbi:MAG: ATP-binding cassette domain-containing protein [Muribaculaceae bacterium]|nr:ATP-binding cassette domain-containing protein [Muribaculaceae bacterium]
MINNSNKEILTINSGTLFYTSNQRLTVEPGLKIYPGITALSGKNGSGKTTFAQILLKGKNFRTNSITACGTYPTIKYIEFNDIHSWTGFSVEYYQQRYESMMNQEVPSVKDILKSKTQDPEFEHLCSEFELKNISERKINYLSSGELRKLLIINALLEDPDLLILDNPYIGLDKNSREKLDNSLRRLKASGKSVMLLISDEMDVPDFIDNQIFAYDLEISSHNLREEKRSDEVNKTFPFALGSKDSKSDSIVQIAQCSIRYGDRVILKDINWTIKEGERWRLTGANGSGKSTLLSILNADNPRGYSSDLTLFGRKRGSGESIWEIKKQIGYVSPEMQLHFHGSGTLLQIVANGLNDTVGLYVKPNDFQLAQGMKWLKHFLIDHLADRLYHTLSSGERQLALVARAMIKEPKLLILDEPMHALDSKNKTLVRNTINDFLEYHPESAFVMVTHDPLEFPDLKVWSDLHL